MKFLSCVQLYDPMDCSPPRSSVQGILQARILEWVAFPSPGDLPDPGIKPRAPALQADALPSEPPGNPLIGMTLCINPDSSVGKESPAVQDTGSIPRGRKIRWRRDRLPTPVFLEFPCGSADKGSACNERDLVSIPEWGRSPGEGKGYPLQDSGLENSMDCVVHGVTKSWTRLSDFHSLLCVKD